MRATATRRRGRGLTLVELMLASAACAMVGLAVAMMMSAISYGTDSRRDMHSLVALGKSTTARLDAAIRGSRQVLSVGSGVVVLWTDDDNGDNLPSLHEVRRIEVDLGQGELRCARGAAGAVDASWSLDQDFAALTAQLLADGRMTSELWATQIAGWQITLDAPAPAAARLVAYRLSIQIGDMVEIMPGVAAMRNAQ